jgi:hypothetical protein
VELASQGFRVVEMDGGFDAWKAQRLDVEKARVAAPRRSISRKA